MSIARLRHSRAPHTSRPSRILMRRILDPPGYSAAGCHPGIDANRRLYEMDRASLDHVRPNRLHTPHRYLREVDRHEEPALHRVAKTMPQRGKDQDDQG